MEELIARLANPSVAGPLVLFIFYILYTQFTSKSTLPSDLPWIGKDSSKLFAETRASLRSFNNVRQWLGEGYEKVGAEESTRLRFS